MDFTNHLFRNFSVAVAIAVAANGSAHAETERPLAATKADSTASAPDDRQQERDVIAKMTEAGYPNFVLLSRKNSKLYLIKDSQFILQTEIILGRGQGQKNRTPSGIFSLTNVFEGEAKPKMSFHIDDSGLYLIHGVVPGREAALDKDNAAARQLSDGCINVPAVTLPYVLGFARDMARANPQQDATPFVVMEGNYSPSKFTVTVSKFTPEKYNFNKY